MTVLSVRRLPMKFDKAQLEALTKDYQTPEEMSDLYARTHFNLQTP